MTVKIPQGAGWLKDIQDNFGGFGTYTVVTADDTAGTKDIDTGMTWATSFLVQIFRSGVNVMDDAIVSISAGVLTVADGGATYALTAGDVINYIVF